jgi:hypothetical protein
MMLPSEMLRQKKLYKAFAQINAVFVSNDIAKQSNARYYLAEEIANNGVEEPILIEQIFQPEDAPTDWKAGALIWGTEEDCTVEQWLAKEEQANDPEYQQYLVLKEKYEK